MPDLRASRRPVRRTSAILFAATLLSACASGPYEARLTVKGTAEQNASFDGQSSAVPIRIVQLKEADKQKFLEADEATLKGKDLGKAEWVTQYHTGKVRVDLERPVEIQILPEVRYLGVIGIFNKSKGPWTALISVDELDTHLMLFEGFQLSKQKVDQ